ncbi:MAG: Carbohydrate kinase [Anaerolineales bacterium]|jgi:rfaE bifunctional protein kinase chain/domain|nr:Carbohydrate kinase [Anaerolineales bacterium]
MDRSRLESLLRRFPALTVLVVGDFFLDKYLLINPQLAEISLETGLEAHQVVEVRCNPGAAGTVTANLRALGVNVLALGVIGDDGESYELKRALRAISVDASLLIECADRFTPTYTKPMRPAASRGGEWQELNRLDIKNRMPLPAKVEDAIITHLREALPGVQGAVIADQVSEADCGVITGRVRAELCALARLYPHKAFAADSRERIGLYQDVILKCNAREAVRAVLPAGDPTDRRVIETCGTALATRARRPVFVTLGAEGIWLFDESGGERVPTRPAAGPIDPVGAGDSVMAGLVSALCAGASPREAAIVGNLAASVTIEQIGTTGTASPTQVLRQFEATYCPNPPPPLPASPRARPPARPGGQRC